ncbi:hypothetical protein [Pontibacter oryzae]|uniref:hypothetical protein n=1 Tax=Pontibacter oryzae TaxID=2304593 RepID=UPI0018F499CC|nr:hypothetical protein [Pontibacter oryzae]
MQAFLYFDLTDSGAYQKPVVAQVRQAFPNIAVLDLDTTSDELLQHYARRMLREATQSIVCIKADESTKNLGSLMPLLEEIFRKGPQRLVILEGEHARLRRMFDARPHVRYLKVEPGQVLEEVKRFLSSVA